MLEKRSHVSADKIKKLSYTEAFKIADVIRAHCKAVDGHAVYDQGWSDAEVLKEINNGLVGRSFTINNVQGIRRQLIGQLRRSPQYGQHKFSKKDLDARITALEQWASERPRAPFERD
jgi:hypothetical protein